MDKKRKTINVSLQSRKYSEPMNELINKWEEDGDNISIQVCETLLKWNELQKSPTMLRIFNMFELIKKSIELYGINDDKKIEEILSSVVKFDATGLNEIFLTMSQIESSNTKKVENIVSKIPIEKETINNTLPKEERPKVVIPKEPEKVEEHNDVPFDGDVDIPMDFLMNG